MFKPEQDSILGWILHNQIKTESGGLFDLKAHPFWIEPLCDWSPKQVYLKCAQVGGTTAMSIKLLFAMQKWGLNAIYTMPTADDAKQFVGGRLNPIIRINPALDSLVQDADSVEQKRIGQHLAYFRGTMTDRAALSVPSDLNVHDEEDRSNRTIIDQYASRQQHSAFKWEWRLSNPSTPGNGVDRFWKQSDQKHWFVKCSHCNHQQFLSWPDSIDQDLGIYVCKSCHGELSDDVRRKGRWVPIKYEVKPEYSGYWFNLMMAPWVTAKEVVKLNRTKSPDYFYNFVLGLPYAGAGNKLNESEFWANLREKDENIYSDPIVIAVDSGLPNWVVIGNKQGVFFHGHYDGWGEINNLMKRFPKAIAICDQGGDLYGQRELQDTFPGRVYLCWFENDKKSMQLIRWGKKKERAAVMADRNRCIQQVIDELRMGRLPIYGTQEDWLEAWQHFANMYKHIERDENTGAEKFEWRRNGPDHLALCFVYYRIGIAKFETGDGAHSVGGVSAFQEFLQPKLAPTVEYGGGMKLPTDYQEPKDWRDV